MNHSLSLPRVCLAIGLSVLLAAIPLQAQQPGWTPSLMMKVKRIGSVQASPDGKQVAYTVRHAVMAGDKSEYLTHIHLAGADGLKSVQLTHGEKSCDDPQWSPDGRVIAFVSNRTGKKNIWLIRPDGGEAERLTDVKTGVISFKWSPDGELIAYTELDPPSAEDKKAVKEKSDARVVDENVRMVRLFEIDANLKAKRAARLLTTGNHSVGGEATRAGRAPFDWSPDSSTIVISHTRTPSPDDWTTADLSKIDVKEAKVQPLTLVMPSQFRSKERPHALILAEDVSSASKFAEALSANDFTYSIANPAGNRSATLNLQDCQAVFLLGLKRPDKLLWKDLVEYVKNGGGVGVIPGGEEMELNSYAIDEARSILPGTWQKLVTQTIPVSWNLASANSQHALMRPFEEWRGQSSKIDFVLAPRVANRYWEAEPRNQDKTMVLVNYNDDKGRPALLERLSDPRRIRSGRVLMFTTTFDPRRPAWNNYLDPVTSFYPVVVGLSAGYLAHGYVQQLKLEAPRPARSSPFYSPDGKWIAFVASDVPPTWPGHKRIHVVPAVGGTARPLSDTADGFGRYSELVGWSAEGTRLFFTEAQGTNLKLLAMPVFRADVANERDPAGRKQKFPPRIVDVSSAPPYLIKLGDGMSQGGVSLNASRTMFGFGWEQLDRAPEAFITSVPKESNSGIRVLPKTAQVSRVNDELLKEPLGRTEVITWKSSKNDLAIEGLLTYPVGYDKDKRYPLLLVIHGGPMGAFMQTFDGSAGPYPVAAFASRGYAVLRPNPRGSSGYGAKFRYANRGDWGGGDYHDLMTGVDRVINMGVGDPNRMGVMGWSYGGFMTSWTITQTRRFKAASVGAGVTNLVSFTGTADIPGFLPDYFRGEFWDDFETYRAHSPMFHIKGANTPTLIQHGEKDERVPLSQGQELYNALKRQGTITKMVVYPRTPHGIEEPRLLLDCMERNMEWFERHVLGAKGAFPTP